MAKANIVITVSGEKLYRSENISENEISEINRFYTDLIDMPAYLEQNDSNPSYYAVKCKIRSGANFLHEEFGDKFSKLPRYLTKEFVEGLYLENIASIQYGDVIIKLTYGGAPFNSKWTPVAKTAK